ncbi:glycosyltransferase [Aerococcus sanguinicola]|uniref:glycosyltransferase n=1 Tax=unclassified Aerococcus TaxID=2618060 RepID=UPI0008A8E99C|nr:MULTISPECIES: glycosyltransferase [unclassified Aerococcus]MDK6233472.1 glycosyltransferase [Aerococcus sp. UMB10185]MDK6855545.1 glycosyltransferase [Aerococcus sp. UMB7533]MDK8502264.1 glycosyltransferase [Aerococcus sp. UMB1112A]OHO43261.1 hypothetical protein HMPREF2705_08390 [Aerococcus sp. HMSC035B07]
MPKDPGKVRRVLHLMSGYGGGISSFIKNKAEEMPHYGIAFDVTTYDECPTDFCEAIEATGGKLYPLRNPKKEGFKAFEESLNQALDHNDYDAFYCHINGYRALPYYYLCRRHSQAPFYIHAHNSNDNQGASLMNRAQVLLSQRLNRYLSACPLGCGKRAIWAIFGSAIDLGEMMIIPNSIHTDLYLRPNAWIEDQKKQLRKAHAYGEDTLLIGHIGRLTAVKNHEQSLAIAQAIKDQGLDAKLLIIGAGERDQELKAAVRAQALEDVVDFTGRINPISAFYPLLDAVVLPSYSEGLPTVVVEAQALGIPVVMSNRVTDEVDLDLGLVEALSLEAGPAEWLHALCRLAAKDRPDLSQREQAIQAKAFSNEASAQLFVEFLEGERQHFNFEGGQSSGHL